MLCPSRVESHLIRETRESVNEYPADDGKLMRYQLSQERGDKRAGRIIPKHTAEQPRLWKSPTWSIVPCQIESQYWVDPNHKRSIKCNPSERGRKRKEFFKKRRIFYYINTQLYITKRLSNKFLCISMQLYKTRKINHEFLLYKYATRYKQSTTWDMFLYKYATLYNRRTV